MRGRAAPKIRLALLIAASCAACTQVVPRQEVSNDGLVRVTRPQVDTLFVAPGMSLDKYRKVMIDDVEVTFRSGWQTQPGVTADDIARIRQRAADGFRAVFASELEDKGGYPVVEQAGPDVLRVDAAVLNLIVTAPTSPSADAQRTFNVSASDMTLRAELHDSQSGTLLARALDHSMGRETGDLRVLSQAGNVNEGAHAFELWASLLRNALDAARTAPPAAN
jgi:hypothetical protein